MSQKISARSRQEALQVIDRALINIGPENPKAVHIGMSFFFSSPLFGFACQSVGMFQTYLGMVLVEAFCEVVLFSADGSTNA